MCWDFITNFELMKGTGHIELFYFALRYDNILVLKTKDDIQKIEQELNVSIQKLSDLDKILDEYTNKAKNETKMKALKIGVAYSRDLNIEETSFNDADKIFKKILKEEEVENFKPLHNYLFRKVIERGEKFNIPVQIHTGYLAGNWKDIRWGDPKGLIPIFQKYKNVKFDIFHASWPYSEFIGAVGKEFPNVYLDLCWAWAMNPVATERILDEWLSSVPNNKIFSFGSDTGSVFAFLGYTYQARQGIANVLQKKISTGEYNLSTAKFVAKRIMNENAREVFAI